jgi:hypothetical protein
MKTAYATWFVLSTLALMPSTAMAMDARHPIEPQIKSADMTSVPGMVKFTVVVPGFKECGLLLRAGDIKQPNDSSYGEIHFDYDATKADPGFRCANGNVDAEGTFLVPKALLHGDRYYFFWGTEVIPVQAQSQQHPAANGRPQPMQAVVIPGPTRVGQPQQRTSPQQMFSIAAPLGNVSNNQLQTSFAPNETGDNGDGIHRGQITDSIANQDDAQGAGVAN